VKNYDCILNSSEVIGISNSAVKSAELDKTADELSFLPLRLGMIFRGDIQESFERTYPLFQQPSIVRKLRYYLFSFVLESPLRNKISPSVSDELRAFKSTHAATC
jgi:hypothetical protein